MIYGPWTYSKYECELTKWLGYYGKITMLHHAICVVHGTKLQCLDQNLILQYMNYDSEKEIVI